MSEPPSLPPRLLLGVARRISGVLARRLSRRMVSVPPGLPPTISFTFDDFPQSAVDVGAPILHAAGMVGTWYAAAGLLGEPSLVGRIASAGSVRDLHRAGHEIGNHTRMHLNATQTPAASYGQDIAANQVALAQIAPGLVPGAFSYPFGAVTAGAKRAAMAQMGTCRGIQPGIVRGAADLALLPANQLYRSVPLAVVEGLVEDVRRSGGWAIFYTHDIVAEPSPWGCTPEYFAAVVAAVGRAGLTVGTVGAVAAKLAQG